MSGAPDLLLGLIGDNIAASRAPLLHRLAGAQAGLSVRYDRLVPKEMERDFEAVFAQCRAGGYRGINVTYPYKERVTALVAIPDPLVRAMGAVNTVIFGEGMPQGFNTDHSGFIAAWRAARGAAAPGTVALIGAGGVGRAVAFGLVALGAREIRLFDRDAGRAEGLVRDLKPVAGGARITVVAGAEEAAERATGLVNCTPVGMTGHAGTPLARAAMTGAEWAFDAVYTPAETQFLADAAAEGAAVISGWELFFWQGVHAWAHFAGRPLDEARLRAELLAAG